MERFDHVLYVERHTGGCGRGHSCAVSLARRHRSRLTVVGMVHATAATDPREPGGAQRRSAAIRRCRRSLDALVRRGSQQGTRTDARVLEGGRVDAILREAVRGGYDLVMKVADDASPAPPWRIDHPDRRLMRDCPCPVWIVEPAQTGAVRAVLAAVDVSDGRSPALNARIVRLGAAVANAAGARLHVVHAWSLVGEPVLASHLTGVSRRRLRNLLAGARRERRDRVERLVAAEAPERPAVVELRKGNAARAVRDVAYGVEADVVVLGSSGRTGMAQLLYPNVAERLLGRVPSSILVVKEVPGRAVGGGGGAEEEEAVAPSLGAGA